MTGVDRETAREAAADELSRRVYQEDQPGLLERALAWLFERAGDVLARAGELSPGGLLGLGLVVVLVVGLVVAVRLRTGPLARSAVVLGPGEARSLTAADHRRMADEHAGAGRYAEAVRERMRAIARELEARGVLEPRLGRTATEVAAEAGAGVPAVAEDLQRAAVVFDEVWYGGRPATQDADARLRAVDERVRGSRLSAPAAAPPAGPPAHLAGSAR